MGYRMRICLKIEGKKKEGKKERWRVGDLLVSKHNFYFFYFRLKMLRFKTLVVTPVKQPMSLEKLRKTTMLTSGVRKMSVCQAKQLAYGLLLLCQFLKW